jgi:hypothetical protein
LDGLEVIAADLGHGIEKPSVAIQEKTKPTGGLGAGLAAVLRLADHVTFDNRITEGVCIVARKFDSRPADQDPDLAIMGRPYPGEVISGDDAAFIPCDSGFLAAVSDGLGHGPEAREASNRSLEALAEVRDLPLDSAVLPLNQALSGTRGCAMCIVRFVEKESALECVSVGDVHAHLYHLRDAHFFTSTPMILGEGRESSQRIRVERVGIQPGSALVMFTDGLKSRTTLKGQLDILRQPAIGIAERLIEREARPDDDALVLVARFRKS